MDDLTSANDNIENVPALITDLVVLPYNTERILLDDPEMIKTIENTFYCKKKSVVVVISKNRLNCENKKCHIGTLCHIIKCETNSFGVQHATLMGLYRIAVEEHKSNSDNITILSVVKCPALKGTTCQDVLMNQVRSFFFATYRLDLDTYLLSLYGKNHRPNLSGILDIAAGLTKCTNKEKEKLLVELDETARLTLLKEVEQKKSGTTLDKKNALSSLFPKLFPKSQMLSMSQSLGSENRKSNAMDKLENDIKSANMTPEALKEAMSQLQRLKITPSVSSEYTVILQYIETLIKIPWQVCVEETCNLAKARKILNDDHYGLEKVKKRLLEYIAVHKLLTNLKGPILCLNGPPGVGKTSVAKSIAKCLGRPFQRVSLGGITDQHEIRGHRRTYVGAMQGRIIDALIKAAVKNPLILLDEVDKLGRGINGDPASALLEVLDHEQNNAFVDSYINIPVDLSKVLFIATSNTLATIPLPLRDRMEIVNINGYTPDEKLIIAKKYLFPKQVENHGLLDEFITVEDPITMKIIKEYTKEAGVRDLNRQFGALCRHVAVELFDEVKEVELKPEITSYTKCDDNSEIIEFTLPEKPEVQVEDFHMTIDEAMLECILGPPKFHGFIKQNELRPGCVYGLVCHMFGGDITLIEAQFLKKGKSQIILTGSIGNVMKESVKLALSWVYINCEQYGIEKDDIAKRGILHIHFPEGAVSKDGPSAGVTVVTAIMSLLLGKPVIQNLAMTGEISLHGDVLPVGGIKDKLLAAHSNDLRRVIIPAENESDVTEISQCIKDELELTLVRRIEDVLTKALEVTPSLKSKM